ncbi:MAG: hypothetical protein ACWA5R_02695, partial [bacterium]
MNQALPDASDYALTSDQKTLIRLMIMTSVPEGLSLDYELLSNRFELLPESVTSMRILSVRFCFY